MSSVGFFAGDPPRNFPSRPMVPSVVAGTIDRSVARWSGLTRLRTARIPQRLVLAVLQRAPATPDEQRVGEPVQVVHVELADRLAARELDDEPLRATAHRTREMHVRRRPAAARQ